MEDFHGSTQNLSINRVELMQAFPNLFFTTEPVLVLGTTFHWKSRFVQG